MTPFSASNIMSSSSPEGHAITTSSTHCLQTPRESHPDIYSCMARSHHYDPLVLSSTYSHAAPRSMDVYQSQYSSAAASTGTEMADKNMYQKRTYFQGNTKSFTVLIS